MAQVIHAFQVEHLELIDGKYVAPYKAFMGAMVPDWLMVRTEISDGAKLTYARLCRYAGKSSECYPSVESLVLSRGTSVSSIKRQIREIIKLGLIEKYKTGKGNRNGYRFLFHDWMDAEKKEEKEEDKKENGKVCQTGQSDTFKQVNLTHQTGQSDTFYNKEEESQLRESVKRVNKEKSGVGTKTKKSAKKISTRYTLEFETFWESSTKRGNKKTAFISFQKIIKSEPELLPEITEAMLFWKKSHQWEKDGGQYAPHVSTWLNQNGWEDERQQQKGGANGSSNSGQRNNVGGFSESFEEKVYSGGTPPGEIDWLKD